MLEVKLEALSDVMLQNGYSIEHFSKGDIVEAKFNELGVKLLFDDTWSYYFNYKEIQKNFKPYGQ